MNIVDTITSVQPFDWAVLAFLALMLVLGFAQGAIRRLLGIASIAFSFLLAANLRDPFGGFLAQYWTQWPREYDFMLAFGILFVVGAVIFGILIQAFYKHAPVFANYPVVDELLGALLGLVQGALLIGAGIVVADSFFRSGVAGGGQVQIQVINDLFAAMNTSGTADVFRHDLIPGLVAVVGPLLPADIGSLFPVR